ncbi:MAG: hypothetical protein HZB65_03195 [Candidatus Aenigmarchaeota archaeon]|nr:hypothetical protein [Candidatus Aenigmarchaeota archaeon]
MKKISFSGILFILFVLVFVSGVHAVNYVDIGIRVYDGNEIVKIAADPIALGPFRIAKNGNIYGIGIVDALSPYASRIRIATSSGIKALRLFDNFILADMNSVFKLRINQSAIVQDKLRTKMKEIVDTCPPPLSCISRQYYASIDVFVNSNKQNLNLSLYNTDWKKYQNITGTSYKIAVFSIEEPSDQSNKIIYPEANVSLNITDRSIIFQGK